MITPLRMPSFLPHDLCHGRSSSRWLPTPGELAALLGSRTDPVWRDPLSLVSREAGLGSASHHEKGDPGRHRLAIRRHVTPGGSREMAGSASEEARGPCRRGPLPRGSTCVQPGLSGGPAVVRVWGPVSGRPCPVHLGQPGPPHSHLGLQLVGAWGARRSPPAHVAPPGPGADPATLTLPPTMGPPKPALLGIRPLPLTTQPPKPVLLGIRPLPLTTGSPKACAPRY